jgi:hypothetical protein
MPWIDGEQANACAKGCVACDARAAREGCPGSTVSRQTPAQKENDMKPDTASEASNDLRNPLWILAYGMAAFFATVAAVMALS